MKKEKKGKPDKVIQETLSDEDDEVVERVQESLV